MTWIKRYLLSLGLIISFYGILGAKLVGENFQADSSVTRYRNSYWIDFGPGWSSRDRAFTASINLELDNRFLLIFSFDNAYHPTGLKEVVTVLSFGFIPVEYKPGFDMKAVSLKFGRVWKGEWGLITCSAGVSKVSATEYSRTNAIGTTSAIGASFDVKVIPAVKFAGLAFNPFFSLNSVQHYGGLTINLALGQLIYKSN